MSQSLTRPSFPAVDRILPSSSYRRRHEIPLCTKGLSVKGVRVRGSNHLSESSDDTAAMKLPPLTREYTYGAGSPGTTNVAFKSADSMAGVVRAIIPIASFGHPWSR